MESDRHPYQHSAYQGQYQSVGRDVLETTRRRAMKRYRGVVVFRYYQEVEVEAESEDEAKSAMCDMFDLSKADGESEVLDIEEIKE